jgi:CelD/BcsL family acetyltransferase involved in cellulose biosynthesis
MMGDGSHDSDNLDFPVRPGCEAEFARALLEYWQQQEDLWDLAQWNTLPANSVAGNFLLRYLKELGWTHFLYQQPSSAIVLPESWESYLNKLSSKERGKLRYYQQRLEKRYDVHFYKCTQESELPTCLDALFELHQKRWQLRGEAGSFGSPARRQFYYEMARSLLARRWLDFWLLELNGQAVAAQFGFRYGETTYALQEGFDPAYSADSVGYVLRGHVLEQAIAEGARRYDFLAGQDVSKDRWGAQAGTYLYIHFAKPFSRGSFYLRLVHNVGKRKERLRAHLPSRAWILLRSLYRRLRNRRVQEREPPFG